MPLSRNESINFQSGDVLNGTTQNRIGFKKGAALRQPQLIEVNNFDYFAFISDDQVYQSGSLLGGSILKKMIYPVVVLLPLSSNPPAQS